MISCISRQVYTRCIAYARAVGARALRVVEPVSRDEDARRKEYILNVIIISLAFLIVLESTIVWNSARLGDAYGGLSPWALGLLILVYISLLYASKRGLVRIGSYIMIGLYAAGTIFGGWTWGVSLPLVLLATALVIVTSSILIGSTFGFITSGAMIIVLLILGIHEKTVLDIPSWHFSQIRYTDIIAYAAVFLFISFIAWLSNREISRSLTRARTSEKLLEKERDSLEKRVSERTIELMAAEQRRICQLEQTARFGELSQGLFHDLMQPLSSVSLHMERLTDQRTSPREINEAIQRSISASKRIGAYLDSIRHCIRMDGARDIGTRSTDVRRELAALRDIFAFKARASDVCMIFDVSPEIETIDADPVMVHRLLSNLISNSLDACSSGCCQSGSERELRLAITDSPTETTIRVDDTGCGMSREELDLAFTRPFSTKKDGLGVGLMNIRHIVNNEFKGSIRALSAEGIGASFTITIPHSTNGQNLGTEDCTSHPKASVDTR